MTNMFHSNLECCKGALQTDGPIILTPTLWSKSLSILNLVKTERFIELLKITPQSQAPNEMFVS